MCEEIERFSCGELDDTAHDRERRSMVSKLSVHKYPLREMLTHPRMSEKNTTQTLSGRNQSASEISREIIIKRSVLK